MAYVDDEVLRTIGLWFGSGLTALLLAEAIRRVVIKPMMSLFKKAHLFLDDWVGEHSRDGFAGREGVMQRLAEIDIQLESVNTTAKRTEWHVGNGDTTRLRTVVETAAASAKTAENRAAAAVKHAATVEDKADDTHELASQNAEAIGKLVKDLSPILRRYQRQKAEGYDDTSEDGL